MKSTNSNSLFNKNLLSTDNFLVFKTCNCEVPEKPQQSYENASPRRNSHPFWNPIVVRTRISYMVYINFFNFNFTFIAIKFEMSWQLQSLAAFRDILIIVSSFYKVSSKVQNHSCCIPMHNNCLIWLYISV